jgi:hypothetical protein
VHAVQKNSKQRLKQKYESNFQNHSLCNTNSYSYSNTDHSYSQLKNLGIKGGLNLSNAELQSEFFNSYSGKESKTGFNRSGIEYCVLSIEY